MSFTASLAEDAQLHLRIASIVAFFLLFLLSSAFMLTPHTAFAASTTTPVDIESQVRAYFKDAPVMVAIARCESKLQQFNSSGTVLRGGWGGGMIGLFQIFESVHRSGAKALGFDLATLAGNMGYAKHLYTTQGTTPWNSSKACWSNAPEAKLTTLSLNTDTRELERRVRSLQRLLAQLERLLSEQKKLTVR